MSGPDTGRTAIDADFAGRRRRFCLRLGEMGELERLTGQGIGGIYLRLAAHQFGVAEVWDTIRLGLEGGGTPAVEASALVMRCQEQPIADFLPLASRIVSAAVTGAPVAGKDPAERTSDGPATSPSSTQPAPWSGGAPGTSTA